MDLQTQYNQLDATLEAAQQSLNAIVKQWERELAESGHAPRETHRALEAALQARDLAAKMVNEFCRAAHGLPEWDEIELD